MMFPSNEAKPDMIVVYDGECVFCNAYIKMLRLKNAIGAVALVNARTGGPYVDEIRREGFDLDEGMALYYGGKWYHGSDCLHLLAMLTSPHDTFNRVTAWMFKSEKRARLLYPSLRFGRNATLKLLGRKKLRDVL